MKVEYNDESLPKGTELHVEGLGTLVNGKSVEFNDEAVTSFEEFTGKKAAEAFKNNANVNIGGSGSKTSDDKDDK